MFRSAASVSSAAAIGLGAILVSSCLMDFEALRPVEGVCGNGQRELGEACDDGGDSAACNADCTVARCGDWYINWAAGERCDDGNSEDGDGCSYGCTEPGNFTVVSDMGATDTEQPFHYPSVGVTTRNGEPHFVLVWIEHHGGKRSVVMRLFGVNGAAVGAEHGFVSRSEGNAICTSIATNEEGRSVVVWRLEDAAGDVHAYYNVIEPGETEAGPADFRIPNSTSPNYLACPEVAAAPSGEFCIVTRANDDLERSFCLAADGRTPTGSAELGSSLFGTFQKQGGIHAITGLSGGFLVTWHDLTSGDWVGRLVDPTGIPDPDRSLITIDSQYGGAWIGSGFGLGQGAVVSAGLRFPDGGDEVSRFGVRLVDSLRSNPTSGQLQFVAEEVREEHAGRLAAHSNGRFVALWTDETGGLCDVLARRYNALDDPEASVLRLVQDPLCGMHPEAAVTPAGDVMFVWLQTNKNLPVTAQVLDLQARIIPRYLATGS